jgi:hypothetical protein
VEETRLTEVGLAQDDRAGRTQGGDQRTVAVGASVSSPRQAKRRRRTRHPEVVLYGDWHPVERTGGLPTGVRSIGGFRGDSRFLEERIDNCVERGVDGLDPRDVGPDDFPRSHIARAHQPPKLRRARADKSAVRPYRNHAFVRQPIAPIRCRRCLRGSIVAKFAPAQGPKVAHYARCG